MKRLFLVLGDAVVFYAALFATLALRYRGELDDTLVRLHLGPMTIIFVVWVVVFYIHNLYSLSFARNAIAFTNTLFRAIAIGAVFAVLYFYLSPQTDVTPKTNLFIHLIIATALLAAWRRAANAVFLRWERRRIALIGQSPAILDLRRMIVERPHLGYDVAFTMPLEDVPHTQLRDIIRSERVRTIIVDNEGYRHPAIVQALFELLAVPVAVERLTTFYESFAQRIPLNAIDHLWFLENISEQRQRAYELGKRITDIVLALAAGAAFAILVLPFALLIKATSPGPVFFQQARMGRGLRPFMMIKFRTMRADAEKDGAQWAQEDDPRITAVGKFLRLSHLDELPQWWNILKGEMSTIGPRAERPEFHQTLDAVIPFYEERYLVRPGVTGWAQINYPPVYGASIDDARAKLEYDLYYIKNRSPALDFSIVLKTLDIIATGRGR